MSNVKLHRREYPCQTKKGVAVLPAKSPSTVAHGRERSQAERRAWVRYATTLETICEPIAALTVDETECGWPARVRDLSAGGVGLSLERRFEPGTILLIELATGQDEPSFVAPVKVIHATADGDGHWILGCAFTRPLDEEQVQALVG
jgi:hypothetical protein